MFSWTTRRRTLSLPTSKRSDKAALALDYAERRSGVGKSALTIQFIQSHVSGVGFAKICRALC
jgi:hypothetical protein